MYMYMYMYMYVYVYMYMYMYMYNVPTILELSKIQISRVLCLNTTYATVVTVKRLK